MKTAVEWLADEIIMLEERLRQEKINLNDFMDLKDDLVTKALKMEESQRKEDFINSQPYYGHCTPEYLEGIEVGAKWQAERMYSEEEVLEVFEHFKMDLPFHYEFLVKEHLQQLKQQEQ